MARELEDGFGVGRAEAFVGGFEVGEPEVGGVFARAEHDVDVAWDLDAEDVLGVLRDAGGVAMAPDGVDFVDVAHAPVAQLDKLAVDDDAGFFEEFAGGGGQ